MAKSKANKRRTGNFSEIITDNQFCLDKPCSIKRSNANNTVQHSVITRGNICPYTYDTRALHAYIFDRMCARRKGGLCTVKNKGYCRSNAS